MRMRTSTPLQGCPADTSAQSEAEPVQLRETLSLLEVRSELRHTVEGEIGRGGMGTVYRVHDRALLRDVAMKSVDSDITGEAEALLMLLEEAQITGQLEHPHIVPVYDAGISADGSQVTFTMKLVRGSTLTSIIGQLHRAAWDDRGVERALRVILKVCDALAFAHSRGVVHRDVKPDNVMVGDFGQVYLMDWGIAMLCRATRERAVAHDAAPAPDSSGVSRNERLAPIIGTPEYMAPEQVFGRTECIDARTDVFGLGGLLYYLLTGCGPNFNGPNSRRARGQLEVVSPEELGSWPNLPPELCRITMKALAQKQEDRYQTVAELQAELEEFLRGGAWFATRRYPAGAIIIRQGDVAHEAYMLVGGTCDVTKVVDETRQFLRHLGPGDVFGETAILTGETRTATVTATTEVVVKVVTAEAFEREFTRRSWTGVFVRAIAERFRDLDHQAASRRDPT